MTERIGRALYLGFVALACLYLIGPTIVVALASVSPDATMSVPPDGFSIRWYRNFFAREEFVSSLILSFGMAFVVALTSTSLAVLLVSTLRRAPRWIATASPVALLLPAVLPTIVLGPALLIFGATTGLARELPGAFVLLAGAHVALTLPYAWQAVSANAAALSPAMEEAAEIAGARRLQIFARVVVPVMIPGIVAGMTFAFLVSFDEPVVSLFVTRHDMVTLPVQTLTYMRFRADPTIAALSTMMSLLSLLAMVAADRYVGLDRIMGLSR